MFYLKHGQVSVFLETLKQGGIDESSGVWQSLEDSFEWADAFIILLANPSLSQASSSASAPHPVVRLVREYFQAFPEAPQPSFLLAMLQLFKPFRLMISQETLDKPAKALHYSSMLRNELLTEIMLAVPTQTWNKRIISNVMEDTHPESRGFRLLHSDGKNKPVSLVSIMLLDELLLQQSNLGLGVLVYKNS